MDCERIEGFVEVEAHFVMEIVQGRVPLGNGVSPHEKTKRNGLEISDGWDR